MVSYDCNNLVMELSFDSIDTPALTKAQLAKLLFEQIGLNKREAKDFIDVFFDLMVEELVEGRDVKVSGFGNFEVRSKGARPGRNPKTGQDVTIPPRRVITFKASGQLKEKIN
jgi:integration host factor subunit alpha